MLMNLSANYTTVLAVPIQQSFKSMLTNGNHYNNYGVCRFKCCANNNSTERKFPFNIPLQFQNYKWKFTEIDPAAVKKSLNSLLSRTHNFVNEVAAPLVKTGKPDSSSEAVSYDAEDIYVGEQTIRSETPSGKLSLAAIASIEQFSRGGEDDRSETGEIHVIVGPMFAGKTTALLRRVKSESNDGRNVAMIKSSKDNRYAKDSVVTHDGIKFPCWALPNLSSFKEKFGLEAYDKLDVIGIDEAQFFGDLYEFCCTAAENDGKTVVIAGLDGDYLRRSFGSVLDVIPLADTITKLTARCELCGKKAFFTLRKTEETKTELIGGAESYMPVCRLHYVNGQAMIGTARDCESVIESSVVQNKISVPKETCVHS